jgi:hypothetical protein
MKLKNQILDFFCEYEEAIGVAVIIALGMMLGTAFSLLIINLNK